ncbi:hypothetical protein J6590_012600 [Homalodisca vitripennis]|nr:hypothetical protein J6590_012600 [Homalodisca vitripennis]
MDEEDLRDLEQKQQPRKRALTYVIALTSKFTHLGRTIKFALPRNKPNQFTDLARYHLITISERIAQESLPANTTDVVIAIKDMFLHTSSVGRTGKKCRSAEPVPDAGARSSSKHAVLSPVTLTLTHYLELAVGRARGVAINIETRIRDNLPEIVRQYINHLTEAIILLKQKVVQHERLITELQRYREGRRDAVDRVSGGTPPTTRPMFRVRQYINHLTEAIILLKQKVVQHERLITELQRYREGRRDAVDRVTGGTPPTTRPMFRVRQYINHLTEAIILLKQKVVQHERLITELQRYREGESPRSTGRCRSSHWWNSTDNTTYVQSTTVYKPLNRSNNSAQTESGAARAANHRVTAVQEGRRDAVDRVSGGTPPTTRPMFRVRQYINHLTEAIILLKQKVVQHERLITELQRYREVPRRREAVDRVCGTPPTTLPMFRVQKYINHLTEAIILLKQKVVQHERLITKLQRYREGGKQIMSTDVG